MSTAELSAPLPAGVFHLLTADNDVASTYGGYMTVCGVQLFASGLPPSCNPPGCEANRDPRYCPECVREAVRRSADGSKSSGRYIGECGHPVSGGPAWRVGPCGDGDPSAT